MKNCNYFYFEFFNFRGGLSNYLFLCSLKEKDGTTNNNTNKILIRIHGLLYDKIKQTDALIMLLLAERKLGPRLLGIFPGGRLEQFIQVNSNLLLNCNNK